MSSKFLLTAMLLAASMTAQDWRPAVPGYRYEFPRDHFNHPDYRTEWWYYTGNLRSTDGHRYGFELTFFRQAVKLARGAAQAETATWRPDEIYLAHLAFSDLDGQQFFHTERLNRAGPALAGADLKQHRYWNGNWQVQWKPPFNGTQTLQAVSGEFTLELTLNPQKPLVIHGKDGVSQKGPAAGEASHYISFTRLAAEGEVKRGSKTIKVSGLAWMDHEFFTEQPDDELAGWDWFSIQLASGEDLMLYRLRLKDGHASPYSSGTYVDAKGNSRFLSQRDFVLTPSALWNGYPLQWEIAIPAIQMQLTQTTVLRNQELLTAGSVTPAYWEGAVDFNGYSGKQKISGVGYLEMTGYRGPLSPGSVALP